MDTSIVKQPPARNKITLYGVSGIYAMKNIVNGKMYVGSAIDLGDRRKVHFGKLSRKQHANPHLQSAFNQYGKQSFEFIVLEFVEDKSRLIEREQFWMDCHECCNPDKGYNIRQKAESNLGLKASEETRRKLGLVRKGNKNSRGTKQSLETIEKRRLKLVGNQWNKGKKKGPLSEQTRQKISKALKGNPKLLGAVRSDDFKRKVSEGMKRFKGKTYSGLISPNGIEYPPIDNLKVFCQENGLKWGSVVSLFTGKVQSVKGWYVKGREPKPRVTSRQREAWPKQEKTFELRQQGYTFQEIAETLGYKDRTGAAAAYKAALDRRAQKSG